MFSKKEILFWIVALIVGVFMAWSCRLQAMDIQKLEEPIKKKLELDIDVTPQNLGNNPYQKWIHLAKTIDAWRIFPRLFLTVYIFLLYYSTMWFMVLEDPSLEQSGLISIIVGAGAAWFGLYAGTSKNKGGD